MSPRTYLITLGAGLFLTATASAFEPSSPPKTTISQANGFPRYQKEEMSFYPGERSHQSFQQSFFNGLCGLCHGAISGRPIDAALNPDLLTQASQVQAAGKTGDNNLNVSPSQRGSIEGPPPTP